MASFQSILTNTMLADISVTCLCFVAAVRLPSDDMAKSLHEMNVKMATDEQDKDDSSDGKEDGSAS